MNRAPKEIGVPAVAILDSKVLIKQIAMLQWNVIEVIFTSIHSGAMFVFLSLVSLCVLFRLGGFTEIKWY